MSRTLFVGDIHGCAIELKALVKRASPTRLVLLGDLFTKGPDPRGVWEIIQEQRAEAVLGNHDDRVLARGRDQDRIPERALDWLATLPLWLEGPGWLAVHAGIDPARGPQGTSRDQLLNMRRYPDGDEGSPNAFWWQLYRGPRLVIYGHDARRGLVDRRPYTLGLDTGCVYGGALTGYLLEEDRVIPEQARRSWRVIRQGD